MITNTGTPALRLETQPTPKNLAELAKYLGVTPAKGQDPAEAIIALVTAIRSNRDHLKAKLEDMPAMQDGGGQHKVIVSASRRAIEDDDKLVQRLIGPTDNSVEI